MAAVTLLGTQIFDTNSGTHTVTATPAVGDLIVIVTACSGNTSAAKPTDNNTDGGGTYTEISAAACVKNTSADQMRVFVRNNFIQSASSTIFTHAPGTSTGGGFGVFKVTGMKRTRAAAVRQAAAQSNQAASSTPAPVFGSAALTGNAVIGAVFNATSPATLTPRTNFTERFDVGYSTPTTGLETMSRDSGETGTTQTWGSTSGSAFCAMVVELDTTVPPTIDEPSNEKETADSLTGAAAKFATALTFAASFSAFNSFNSFNDDIVPWLPFEAPSVAASGQRAVSKPVFFSFKQVDELPVFVQPAVDEYYEWVARTALLPPARPALLADDEIVPFVASILDEVYAWSGWTATTAPNLFLPQHSDETTPKPDDSYWWQAQRALSTQTTWVITADDEIVAQNLTFPVDEDYWQLGWSASPTIYIRVQTADEEIVPQPVVVVDETEWNVFTPKWPQPIVTYWVEGDFVQPPLSIAEEYQWPDRTLWPVQLFKLPPVAVTDDSENWPTPFVPPPFDATIKFDITTGMLVKPLSAKIVMLI